MENNIKLEIEKTLKTSVELIKATDCVNLMFEAFIKGVRVASVYKSFDQNFNPIMIIRYPNN
jgi:hypothetical protein